MWTPVKLYNEPSTHRMHWIKHHAGKYALTVKPLRFLTRSSRMATPSPALTTSASAPTRSSSAGAR